MANLDLKFMKEFLIHENKTKYEEYLKTIFLLSQSEINQNKILSSNTIILLQTLIYEILEPNYYNSYIEGKKLRLENLDDINKYCEILLKYEIDLIKILIEKVTLNILKCLKINESIYEMSFNLAIQENQNIAYIPAQKMINLKENVLKKKEIKKDLTIDLVVEFFKFQIKLIDKYDIKLFSYNLEFAQNNREKYILDLAFKKFNFDLIDINHNQEILNHQKYKEIVLELDSKFKNN